jgi:hypothetical protein
MSIASIATGLSGDALISAINLRIAQLNAALATQDSSFLSQATGPLNMGGFQINALADPAAATDALNLRSADKRYASIGSVSQISGISAAPALPFITPEEKGAVGDGVADDTIAVQAALNSGIAVMLREQAVYLCSALTFPSGLSIVGLEGSTIRQKASSAVNNTPFITITAPNVSVDGVTFDGNEANQGSVTGVDILSIYNASNVVIKNCSFENSVRSQIYGQLITGIEIKDCNFYNWGAPYAGSPHNMGAIYLAGRASNNFGGPGGAITRVRIRGCTVDGRGANPGSCIKLDGDLLNPVSDIIIQGNHCYPGNSSNSYDSATLAIELYCGPGQAGAITDFTVYGNVIEAQTNPSPNAFGISCGGSGPIGGSIVANRIKYCGGVSIENIGSNIACIANTIESSSVLTINASANNCQAVTVAHNIITNPTFPTNFGYPQAAIQVLAQVQSGTGPYSITDCDVSHNTIEGLAPAFGYDSLAIECQINTAGCTISRTKITHNTITGTSTAHNTGIVDNGDHVFIFGNVLNTLAIGIGNDGTYSRYILNRFESVTYQYGTTIQSDAIVIDIDTGDTSIAITSLKVLGAITASLRASGDFGLPLDVNAYVSGDTAQEGGSTNPNVVTWNGINFGTELEGGVISVNSRWGGFPNWNKTSAASYAYAMFLTIGAGRFGVAFGNATNTNGATPGTLQFWVDDPNSSGTYPGANCVNMRVSSLAGSGTRLVTCTNTGQLGAMGFSGTGVVVSTAGALSVDSVASGNFLVGGGSGSPLATLPYGTGGSVSVPTTILSATVLDSISINFTAQTYSTSSESVLSSVSAYTTVTAADGLVTAI